MVIKITENLFLDTNVYIGLIYELDSLNLQSTEIVSSDDTLYYSYHVKTEIDKVYIRKNNEYRRFFSLLQSKLRKYRETDFISQTSLHQFIDKSKSINKLSIENMHYAFDRIWESLALEKTMK